MEYGLDQYGNIETKQNNHRKVIECGDWQNAEALGLTEYATENWTNELITAWENLKKEAM